MSSAATTSGCRRQRAWGLAAAPRCTRTPASARTGLRAQVPFSTPADASAATPSTSPQPGRDLLHRSQRRTLSPRTPLLSQTGRVLREARARSLHTSKVRIGRSTSFAVPCSGVDTCVRPMVAAGQHETCPVCESRLTRPRSEGERQFDGRVFRECERFPRCPGLRPHRLSGVVPIDWLPFPDLGIALDISQRLRRAATLDPDGPRNPPHPIILGGRLVATDEDDAQRWHQIKTWASRNGYAYLLPASIRDPRSAFLESREIPIPYGDALLDTFRAARAQDLSWDIGRRGDGAPELRHLIREAVGTHRSRPDVLAGCAATLPLGGVARIVGFPDWLGYLGVILHEVGHHPPSLLRLGAAWAPQFIRMGGGILLWEPFGAGTQLLTWRTLELAERDRLGATD